MSPTRRPSSVPGLRSALQGSQAAAASAPVTGLPAGPPPRPEKPVRFTLDLDRDRHRFLKEFAVRSEADASQVIRVLLDQLREDGELAARVQAAIWSART